MNNTIKLELSNRLEKAIVEWKATGASVDLFKIMILSSSILIVDYPNETFEDMFGCFPEVEELKQYLESVEMES